MNEKEVTVCGGGVLGSQISWLIALKGFKVKVHDINNESIERCKTFHKKYSKHFKTEKPFENLNYSTNLEEATRDSFLVVESISENPQIKAKFYTELSAKVEENVIITTNTSTMKPSELVQFVKHPERFLAMHFANPIWVANIAEIMGHKETDKSVFDRIVKFVEEIGMIPIKIHKEQRGYVLNTMLIPWISAAQHLYFSKIADFKDIDRVWMRSTNSPIGPFGVMDLIGLKTIYDVVKLDAEKTNSKELKERAETIKREFLDKGRLGVSTGRGFYTYPDPEYRRNNFIKR